MSAKREGEVQVQSSNVDDSRGELSYAWSLVTVGMQRAGGHTGRQVSALTQLHPLTFQFLYF